jgi:hypothetical protein
VNTDAITLQIPPDKQFHGVARLVVGGLAARLDLSYEHLEDLQLALATVLDNGYSTGSNVTVKLAVSPGSVAMAIGPLARDRLHVDLGEGAGDGISLHRLLSTLVDVVEHEPGEGGEWLRLEKRAPMKQP